MAKKVSTVPQAPIKAAAMVLPSNFSTTRKIDATIGQFYAAGPEGEIIAPVEVTRASFRGPSGTHKDGYLDTGAPRSTEDPELNIRKPNLQAGDIAQLPMSASYLRVDYSLRIHGDLEAIDVNDREVAKAIAAFVDACRPAGLINDLGARIVWNIMNGRALWRNRSGSEVMISVRDLDSARFWGAKANTIPLLAYPGLDALAAASIMEEPVSDLIALVGDALASQSAVSRRLEVRMLAKMVPGAPVWPSQEMTVDGEKDKILYSIDTRNDDGSVFRHAAMHTQKIWNALRTIDEWHGGDVDGAIAVEVYGFVQRLQMATRLPGQNDAYTLFKTIPSLTAAIAAGHHEDPKVRGDALFLLGLLMRGGVWGKKADKDPSESGKKKSGKAAPAAADVDLAEGVED
jgi:CRISPR-associated protein Csy3